MTLFCSWVNLFNIDIISLLPWYLDSSLTPLFNLHHHSPGPLFSVTVQVCFAHSEDDQHGHHHLASPSRTNVCRQVDMIEQIVEGQWRRNKENCERQRSSWDYWKRVTVYFKTLLWIPYVLNPTVAARSNNFLTKERRRMEALLETKYLDTHSSSELDRVCCDVFFFDEFIRKSGKVRFSNMTFMNLSQHYNT